MYNYTEFDDAFIKARNSQFRNQVKRRIDGNLTEDEFKPPQVSKTHSRGTPRTRHMVPSR